MSDNAQSYDVSIANFPRLIPPSPRLQLEHIRPRKHGGLDHIDNLALACIDCNLRKGPNLTGIDPVTGSITELYNPRTEAWDTHFVWVGTRIEGRTEIGRATIAVLDLNSADRLTVRVVVARAPRQ